MRAFALSLALLATVTASLSGCTSDDDDKGRLEIVLRIPKDMRAWGLEHVYVTVVNISMETTDNEASEWKPTRRNLDLAQDATVLDALVPFGEYDNFDFYVENLRGVYENGTEVPIKTEPFPGRHHVHQDAGKEVIVLPGEELRFEISSELVKDPNGALVWK